MTPNQIILILRIYRGSFNGKALKGTDETDIRALKGWKLIEEPDDDGALYVSVKGEEYIQKLRSITP